jgi:hypothetical protein
MTRLALLALACVFLLASMAASATAQQVKPSCNKQSRTCMIATAATYIDGLARHDASNIPFATDVRSTVQGRVIAENETLTREQIKTGPDMAKHADDRFFVDEKTNNVVVFSLLRVTGGTGNPLLKDDPNASPGTVHLAVRLKDERGLIEEVETIFVREEGTTNGTTNWPPKTPVQSVGPATVKPGCFENSRECIVAAAKVYFDGIVSKDASKVPFAANVRRTLAAEVLEGEPALRHFLNKEEPPMTGHKSHYFVDERQHTVVVYTVIGITAGGQPVTSHVADRLRVENGYITEIEGFVFGEPGTAHGGSGWPD